MEKRNRDEETDRERGTREEKEDREGEGGRKKEIDRVWQRVRDREVERRSEILLIHRDRLRFRGNVVSIVTALLRMPLVGNKKKNATHRWFGAHTFTQIHTITQQSPTCIYTSYYTNKHTQALKISCTHTDASTHTALYSPDSTHNSTHVLLPLPSCPHRHSN